MSVAPYMRRVVVSTAAIETVQAPIPTPKTGEVLVHAVISGVCGSDTHAAHGRHPFIGLPYHPGHEVVGVITELGTDVADLSVGQRVTVEPDLPCWDCKQCRSGSENLCENLQFFGCGYEQGGMADFFTIPANRLHVIPDDLGYRAAALIEPLSTPVHAARIAGGVRDKAVVIMGAGTIGLLLLSAIRAQGARRIVVTDPIPAKRELAHKLGADAVVDANDDAAAVAARDALGESADIVFDCVAVQSTVDLATALASKGGTVVIVGVASSPVHVRLPIVQDHQIRIQGSATYLPQDYAESIRLLRNGDIPIDSLVTAEVPMDDAQSAYHLSSSGAHVKVLVVIDPAELVR